MSSPAIPLPGKFSDAHFVGDLISLFERRKVKCGDAQSFDNFTTELVSNSAFRSDLFTLCTAISHMAAEDLSGEQLLVLVARALSGTGIAKGAAVPEIPAKLRTVFLGGYEAWSNRAASAMEEASVWPPPRKAVPQDEAAPVAEEGSEPVATKSPAEGGRTFQEALEIARERSPNGLITPRSSAPGPNIEHLTISELKKLLEEIEQRMSRIAPQLGRIISSPADDPERSVPANRADSVRISDLLTDPAEAESAKADVLRAPRGAVVPFESAARPAPPAVPLPAEPQGEFDEAAFLKRHRYLIERNRPGGRLAPDTVLTARGANPAPTKGVPAAAAANPPTAPAPAADLAATLHDQGKAEGAGRPAAPVAAPLVDGTAASVAAMPAAAEPAQPRAEVRAAGRVPAASNQADDWYPPENDHINIRAKVSILAVVGFFVIAGCLSGIFVYESLHPKTIDDFPDLTAPAPASPSPSPSSSPSQSSADSPVIVDVPEGSAKSSNAPRTSRDGRAGVSGSKGRSTNQPVPAVAVWPPSNVEAAREAGSDAASQAATNEAASGATAANRHTSPVHVPSSTMIGYALSAPKPVYPADQAKGIIGTVELEVSISKRGNVTYVRAVGGPVELRRAAEHAVEEWRFRPYLVDGDPTEVTTTVGFFFNGR